MLSDLKASRQREARVMPAAPASETASASARRWVAPERHAERIVAEFAGGPHSGGRASVMARRRLGPSGLAEQAGRRPTRPLRIEARDA